MVARFMVARFMVARFQTTRRPFILFLPAGDVMKKPAQLVFPSYTSWKPPMFKRGVRFVFFTAVRNISYLYEKQ